MRLHVVHGVVAVVRSHASADVADSLRPQTHRESSNQSTLYCRPHFTARRTVGITFSVRLHYKTNVCLSVASVRGVHPMGGRNAMLHVKEMDFFYILFFSANTATLRVC